MEDDDKKIKNNEVNNSFKVDNDDIKQPLIVNVKSESKINTKKLPDGKIIHKGVIDQDTSSDDEIPLSELLRRRALNSSTKVPIAKATNNSDDDDDVPIAELIKRKAANDAQNSTNKKIKVNNIEPKKLTIDAIKAENSLKLQKKSSNNEKSKPKLIEENTKPKINGSKSIGSKVNDFYQDSKKGYLVQQLLVRWWYAIQWPNLEEIGPPPRGYVSLDGFPGVFVSTTQETLGTLLDKRNKATCPCLANLIKKPSSELQALCIRAIEEQIRQLRESEGEDTNLEKTLKEELKQVKLINATRADEEAKKYTKMEFK